MRIHKNRFERSTNCNKINPMNRNHRSLFSWGLASSFRCQSIGIELSGMVVHVTTQNTAPFVVVNFTLLPGNDPVLYGNWAGFWWDNGGNFWEDEPISWANAEDATMRQVIIPLKDYPYGVYHVGYYCTPHDSKPLGAPAAMLSFPGVSTGRNPFSSSVIPLAWENGKLTVRYDTPKGNNPHANENSIVLFEGGAPCWDGSWQHKIGISSSQASDELEWALPLTPGGTYTLAYMNGQGSRNLSACSVFTLPD